VAIGEVVAEDEAAFETPDQTFMEIQTELVPKVRELIAKYTYPQMNANKCK